jgi:UDPglucose 6-dehydrogenase
MGVLGSDLAGHTVAVWGLAFKAQTDDMRESPAIDLIETLLAAGARVRAHDPEALRTARRVFADRVEYYGNAYDALEDASALVIVTEWFEYRNPNFGRMKAAMKSPLVVDGRNLYRPERMRQLEFSYLSLGRQPV